MTEEIRCPTGRLSSPFQGSTAHPHMREGVIKGVLNKAHPETKMASLPRLAVLPLKAVKINNNNNNSETRLAEEGSIAESKGGCTFFWKGKAKDEDRMHGVGLAIKTSLSRQLPELPTPVSERLMKLRFRLNPFRHVTVISAYAPNLTSSDEAKDAFYEELNGLMKGVRTPPKRQAHPAGRL